MIRPVAALTTSCRKPELNESGGGRAGTGKMAADAR
jgi:hypothetical protein